MEEEVKSSQGVLPKPLLGCLNYLLQSKPKSLEKVKVYLEYTSSGTPLQIAAEDPSRSLPGSIPILPRHLLTYS
jgi:hypothetical protein